MLTHQGALGIEEQLGIVNRAETAGVFFGDTHYHPGLGVASRPAQFLGGGAGNHHGVLEEFNIEGAADRVGGHIKVIPVGMTRDIALRKADHLCPVIAGFFDQPASLGHGRLSIQQYGGGLYRRRLQLWILIAHQDTSLIRC